MLFQDDFNRADANLEASANWTQVDGTAGWGAVRSNALACLTADGVGAAYQCPDTGAMAHYVQAKLSTVGASSGPFLCVRLADRNNFLGVRYDSSSNRLEFYRRNAGTLTNMAPAAITCVTNDVIRLEVDSGGGWIIKKNGVTADSGTSSAIAAMTSTRAGVVMRAVVTNPWVDDFEAGSTTPPAGTGLDFPNSPSVGQIFDPGGGMPRYVWTGVVWNAAGTTVPKTWIGIVPPSNPVDGDFWYNNETGLLFVRYNDGNSTQWVAADPNVDFAGLDTRYVQKTGDRMTGPLTVYNSALPVAGNAAQVVAGTLVSGVNLGLNLYLDAAGTNWPRVIAGYGGIIQCSPTDGQFAWFSGSTGAAGANATLTQPMTLTAAGNLSILGTYTSSQNFQSNTTNVVLASQGGGVYLRPNGAASATGQATIDNAGNLTTTGAVYASGGVQLVTNGGINTNSGTNLSFSTGGASRGYFNAANGGLVIAAPSGSNPGISVNAAVGNHNIYGGVGAVGYASVMGYAASAAVFAGIGYNVSSQNWGVYTNGSGYAPSGSWQSSDGLFKDIREVATEALPMVEAIPIRHFSLKGPLAEAFLNGPEQFGFIAQEVEAVLPIAVMDIGVPVEDKAMREFIGGEEPTHKALNDHYLLATLWQAVQELSATNKALADRVAALEAA